jgi:hypothetical protein
MDIYTLLKNDHADLLPKLEQLIGLVDGDKSKKITLAHEIRADLNAHSRAEETVFYNSLRDIPSAEGLVEDRYQEHAAADALLHMLVASETLPLEWKEAAFALKDALEVHVADEEDRIIPAAQKLLLEHEAEMMGTAFLQLKQELKGQEESHDENLLGLVANHMPERFRIPTNHI